MPSRGPRRARVAFDRAVATLVATRGNVAAALAAAGTDVAEPQVGALVARAAGGAGPELGNEVGSGLVLLALERALLAVRDAPSCEAGAMRVVLAGGDTDTSAAITGALLGARDGVAAIPPRWRAALLGQDVLEAALHRLLGR